MSSFYARIFTDSSYEMSESYQKLRTCMICGTFRNKFQLVTQLFPATLLFTLLLVNNFHFKVPSKQNHYWMLTTLIGEHIKCQFEHSSHHLQKMLDQVHLH